jgi:hypothetical protein
VNDFVIVGNGASQSGGIEEPPEIGIADLVTGDGDLVGDQLRPGHPGRDIDGDMADVLAGHPLGGLDRRPDRQFGRVQIDEGATPHAPRRLVSDPDHPQSLIVRRAGDEATGLGGADIERGDQAVASPGLRRVLLPCHRCYLPSFTVVGHRSGVAPRSGIRVSRTRNAPDDQTIR